MKKKELRNKEKAITLIALVVTIVVLLILAGVSLSFAFGERGIVKKAQEAAVQTEIAEEKEEIQRAVATVRMNKINSGEGYTTGDVAEQINSEQEGRVTYYDDYIKYNKSGREYLVEGDGNTSYIDIDKTTDTTPGELAGDGTENNPYLIESIEDLVAFEENVNTGETYENKHLKITRDLDFKSSKSYALQESLQPGGLREKLTTGEGFKSISGDMEYTYNSETKETNYILNTTFKGIFDGNNKTLRSFYANRNIDFKTDKIDENTTLYSWHNRSASLFGTNEGTIKDLTMENVNITSDYVAASLAGANCGEISNVKTTGNINSTLSGSGMVSKNENGIINNCINATNVSVKDGKDASGICLSLNGGTIQNCYNYGKISLISSEEKYAGECTGIVGYSGSGSVIRRCYNSGEIIQKGYTRSYVGGIISGGTETLIEECYNTGKITANGTYCARVGGIISKGYKSIIKNTYNTGNIDIVAPAKYTKVGGIIGEDSNDDGFTITNCYNVGIITAVGTGYIYKGDIEGQGGNSTTNITNSFYLTPGTEKINGTGSPTVTDCAGKSAEEMVSKDFLDLINVDSVWEMDINNINKGYPILKWQQE